MLAEQLNKAWAERRKSTAIDAGMRFSDEGLVFGAGTVLAPASDSARDVSIDPLEPRLIALLTAAHLSRPTARALTHLGKAAESWRNGEDPLASMHLVLSKLERLRNPEADACRLFIADGLLKMGVEPNVVVDAIESGGDAFGGLEKEYNPEEPRVPVGSGRESGQWTTGGATLAGPQPGATPPQLTLAQTARVYTGPKVCQVATALCVNDTFNDRVGLGKMIFPNPWGPANDNTSNEPPANDNIDPEERFRMWRQREEQLCRNTGENCKILEAAVDYNPLGARAGVLFPNGGIVIMETGTPHRYYPPGELPATIRRP
jgi:hypothetical protein